VQVTGFPAVAFGQFSVIVIGCAFIGTLAVKLFVWLALSVTVAVMGNVPAAENTVVNDDPVPEDGLPLGADQVKV